MPHTLEQYPPLLHSSFQALSHTHYPFRWNTVSPLCARSKELAVLGFSLKLIIFIFSIISLVSRRSREGLETVRECWNGQVCFTTRSKTSWEVPLLIFLPAANLQLNLSTCKCLDIDINTYILPLSKHMHSKLMLHHTQTAMLFRNVLSSVWQLHVNVGIYCRTAVT